MVYEWHKIGGHTWPVGSVGRVWNYLAGGLRLLLSGASMFIIIIIITTPTWRPGAYSGPGKFMVTLQDRNTNCVLYSHCENHMPSQPIRKALISFLCYNIMLFCPLVIDTASKLIHLLHSTEFPFTSFAVLETGTCLVADSGFDSLMTKLKTFYTPRKTSKIEVTVLLFLLNRWKVQGQSPIKFSTSFLYNSFVGAETKDWNLCIILVIVEIEVWAGKTWKQCWGSIRGYRDTDYRDPYGIFEKKIIGIQHIEGKNNKDKGIAKRYIGIFNVNFLHMIF